MTDSPDENEAVLDISRSRLSFLRLTRGHRVHVAVLLLLLSPSVYLEIAAAAPTGYHFMLVSNDCAVLSHHVFTPARANLSACVSRHTLISSCQHAGIKKNKNRLQ